jgi:cyanophycin synthetase
MEETEAIWLSHLSSEIVADARGPELDAYAVALEGWRRGLTLRWHAKDSEKFKDMKVWFEDNPGKLFSLNNGERTHYFFRTRGDKVTNEAVDIGRDKNETKKYLEKANVPHPKGARFLDEDNHDKIVSYANSIGYPVVLKPTDGSFGRGVVTNIQNEEELLQALEHVRGRLGYGDVLLEQHIPGKEYRLYVVADKVVGAMNRIPSNVTGDGVSTIKQLIDKKNKVREQNPRLISCPIKIDERLTNYIASQGLTLDSVIEKGQLVYLRDISNISIGGDPVDVFDKLSEEIKETAVKAIAAIPGLHHGAVDLIVSDAPQNSNAAVVIELNPTAQIGSLLFPMKGRSRDIPAAIIDYYFPETVGLGKENHRVYFDLPDVLEPLRTRTVTVSTVTPAPNGKIYAKKYVVTGEVQRVDYHRGLRKQAFERELFGFVKRRDDGNIEVVVAGTDPENVNEFREAILEDPERSTVENIQEEPWSGPIKIGFEIKADLKTQVSELKEKKLELEKLHKELKEKEKEYLKYKKSFSWRITSPIRKGTAAVKWAKRNLRK